MSQPVFAHHAHVFPESMRPEGTVDRLLELLDACRIERAVCFAPFHYQARKHGIDPNRWLADRLAGEDRLMGFGTIDVHVSGLEDQVRQVADLGFRGIKLHPNAQEFDLLSPEAMRVCAAAEQHNLFMTFHTGVHHYRLEHYRVTKFDEIAQHFPNLRFSLEHVGGYHFFNEALAVIVNRIPFPPVPGRRCLVFAGLTSIFSPERLRMWYMSRERLLELIAQTGVEQLIFGLDFPYNLEDDTLAGLRTIRSLGLSESQVDAILGGNLRREMGLGPGSAATPPSTNPPPEH